MLNSWIVALFCGLVIVGSEALPEHKNPSKNSHIKHWKQLKSDGKHTQTTTESSNNDRNPHLRFTTGYGEKNGILSPAIGIGAYAPARLNFAGTIFSLVLGIGASLIFPRLLAMFSSGNGLYARSSDDNMTNVTDMLKKIDEFLEENKIDSKNCLQRAVCSYMRSTETRIKRGAADEFDQYVHTLSSNSLVDYMLDGTAIKEAMKNGKEKPTDECDAIYSQCSLDMSTALKILTKLLPNRAH